MEIEGNQNQTTEQQSAFGAIGSFLLDLVKILVIALVIIVPFRMFVAEPFVVSGLSMLPGYHNKDYLIIDRFTYHQSEPQRGDVIVLKYPKDKSQFFIKRVIGLPGETVYFKQGHVFITNTEHPQGFQLEEPYLNNQQETFGKPEPITLGSDEYYVLGDNRTASSDSRVWGILPKDDIVGKAWLRVFPLSRFEKIQHYSY